MSQNSYLVKSFVVILVPNKYVTPFCNVKMLIITKLHPVFVLPTKYFWLSILQWLLVPLLFESFSLVVLASTTGVTQFV